MSSILGPAPVVDFDGTLASLGVPWEALRARLGVRRIDDLWGTGPDAWDLVTEAELRAAEVAPPVEAVVALLGSVEVFSILTSNSEQAVWRFLDPRAPLADKARIVVGRESLGGPKSDFEIFARGFRRCVDATAAVRRNAPVVYVGDAEYELDFAARLGAEVYSVLTLQEGR